MHIIIYLLKNWSLSSRIFLSQPLLSCPPWDLYTRESPSRNVRVEKAFEKPRGGRLSPFTTENPPPLFFDFDFKQMEMTLSLCLSNLSSLKSLKGASRERPNEAPQTCQRQGQSQTLES